jgi:membrane protein required for beta-lactamase induction
VHANHSGIIRIRNIMELFWIKENVIGARGLGEIIRSLRQWVAGL